jgi:hypothetical protein
MSPWAPRLSTPLARETRTTKESIYHMADSLPTSSWPGLHPNRVRPLSVVVRMHAVFQIDRHLKVSQVDVKTIRYRPRQATYTRCASINYKPGRWGQGRACRVLPRKRQPWPQVSPNERCAMYHAPCSSAGIAFMQRKKAPVPRAVIRQYGATTFGGAWSVQKGTNLSFQADRGLAT